MFEHLIRNVPAQGALFALGMPAQTVATSTLVYAAFALHGHSNLRIGGRRLELVLVTPRLHRLHHLPATTQSNFGTVFTLWDRLFGRLVVRNATPAEHTGVPNEIDDYPQRFLVAFRQPVKETRARHAHRRAALPTEAPAVPVNVALTWNLASDEGTPQRPSSSALAWSDWPDRLRSVGDEGSDCRPTQPRCDTSELGHRDESTDSCDGGA